MSQSEPGIDYIEASVYAINLTLFFFSARAVQSEAYTVVLSFFPRGVLDEILNLTESVSEEFPSYSYTV